MITYKYEDHESCSTVSIFLILFQESETYIVYVTLQAHDYVGSFENYSYLWLDDRQMFLQQFLLYGRQLDPEECERLMCGEGEPNESPPTMEQFKEQVIIKL